MLQMWSTKKIEHKQLKENKVLEDFVCAEEGKSLKLKCRFSRSILPENEDATIMWTKDNNLITPGDKVEINKNGMWHELKLKCVNKEDHGVYCFIIKTNAYDVYTKCLVYIKPPNFENKTFYFPDPLEDGVGVKVHLHVEEEEKFQLRADFSANVLKCMWFKNNCKVSMKNPRTIKVHCEDAKSILYINREERADSGIYAVIAETVDKKYLSSFADVLMMDESIRKTTMHMWQAPKYITQVYEKDDVILTFKINHDRHTIIKWSKGGDNIEPSDRIAFLTCANRYIALKITGVNRADSGKYYLILRSNDSKDILITSVILSVKSYKYPLPGPCPVTEGLKQTVACVGESTTLNCSFSIPDSSYVYVVWIIGCQKIKRSNLTYNVICGDTDFILHIPTVIHEMAGEVTCQLRKHIAPRHSILLSKTTSRLVVLPPLAFKEAINGGRLISKNNIYYNSYPVNISNTRLNRRVTSYDDIIMYFQFCKISGGKYLFEIAKDDNYFNIDTVSITNGAELRREEDNSTNNCWHITWAIPNKEDWYTIELLNSNGIFSEIITSSKAGLDIKDPPEDRLFKFRVKLAIPRKRKIKKTFTFAPAQISFDKLIGSRDILEYTDYKNMYRHHLRFGRGSYGYVNLVCRQDGELFASKITKFAVQSKGIRTDNYFNILKTLNHRNTISLFEGFYRKSGVGLVLTMEYLWGGVITQRALDIAEFSEAEIIKYIRQVLKALEYIHANNIAYLDIKPENIVFINPNSKIIKLIDFGLAKVVKRPITLPTTSYGCLDYLSPEIVNGELVSTNSDMWSVGVLTYWLLTSILPFTGSTQIQKRKNISKVAYSYDDVWRVVSDRAKTFVSLLLRRQPVDRMTATTALHHEWIVKGPEEEISQKIAVQAHGGLLFYEPAAYIALRWKVIVYVLRAVLRFKSQQLPHRRRRYLRKRKR